MAKKIVHEFKRSNLKIEGATRSIILKIDQEFLKT